MTAKKIYKPNSLRWTRLVLAGLMLALLTAGGLTGSAPQAQASGGMPSSIFDLNSVAWASIRNYTSADFSDYFDDKAAQEYMLIDYEVTEINRQQRVSGVFQKNVDGRDWVAFRNLTGDQFSEKWNQYKDAGYRPIEQDGYVLNGQLLYSLIMIENKESLAWASRRNLTSKQFSEEFDDYKDDFIPVDIEAYPVGASTRYAIIWVENVENLDWVERRNLTSAQFSDYFQQYKGKFRVHDIEAYLRDGNQNYAAIWIGNKNGRAWKELRDMTVQQYVAAWQANWDAGYRVTDFEVYDTPAGEKRYAAVWRQNSIRPHWRHKNAVDDLLEQAEDDFDIPGMSVAIAKGNTFLYLRGFGYADIDDDKKASSQTIYRLASVSKAIAGVLGLDLQEEGHIDLNEETRTYVPKMPAHHTHLLWHTLSNRSGIGHYPELPEPPNAQYDTALAAIQFYWDEPLLFPPGTDSHYSTHASGAFAAAAESALGESIITIIEEELNNKYNLPTLLVENRSQPDPDRASLYDWVNGQNVESHNPDNISWKVLGGGLEASAYDLAQFGIKLLNGSILSQASLQTLWTPPDGFSNYAYGWSTGNEACSAVVAKNGAQFGARSYTRIYPDLDIVIVLLSNRSEGGHNMVQLGRDIGAIMLETECNDASGSVQFRGLEHVALGAAQIVSENDRLSISNLGFKGRDGVSIKLNRASSWQAAMSFDFNRRAEAVFSAKAQERAVSSLKLFEKDDVLSIAPDFAGESYQVVYMNGDAVVGETTQPTGSSAAVFDWDEINCLLSGDLSFICKLKIEHWQDQNSGGSTWSVALAEPVSIDLPGGPVRVDSIKMVELQPDDDPDSHATLITSMQLAFAYLNMVVIEDEVILEEIPGEKPEEEPEEEPDQLLFYLPLITAP